MTPALRSLADEIEGALALPGSAAYEALRAPAEPRFAAARPAAVVRVADEPDVVATLGAARAAGLEVRVRAGGHCFDGRSSTDGVVLDVGALDAIAVDAAAGRVRIGAGARLGAVIAALAEHGLAVPTGCGPEVGVAGLTLGGGLGVLGRLHGLTSDRLTAVRAVAPDGRVVRADAGTHADLFWALRGAGAAGLAVVTELEFAPVAAPAVATTFRLEWPAEQAAAVFAAWQAWAPDAPRELAASLHVSAPADPRTPAVAEVSGAHAGPRAEAEALLDELASRAGARPAGHATRELAWAAAKADLATLPGPHAPDAHATRRSAFHAAPLDPGAIAALTAHVAADRRPGESRELDVSPWAGAYGDPPADATAFAWRDARLLLAHVVATPPSDAAAAARAAAWRERSRALAGGALAVYPNFPEPGHPDPATAHHGPNAARLRAVKRGWDPLGALGDPLRLLDQTP